MSVQKKKNTEEGEICRLNISYKKSLDMQSLEVWHKTQIKLDKRGNQTQTLIKEND